MKRLLTVGIAALVGALAGSAIRQLVVQKASPGGSESRLVIAAHPAPLVAGTVSGLLVPKYRQFVAFIVAINVAANIKTGGETQQTETDSPAQSESHSEPK